MTPEERARLRELAEAVPMPGDDPELIGRWWDAGDLALYPIIHEADRQFVMATSPDVVRSLLDALDAAEAERDRLAAAVERVRALHNRQPSRLTGDYCAADGDDYPCPTRRALDGGGE